MTSSSIDSQNARSAPVLVTGATGAQGGATVRALLDAGRLVRILVRDPASAAALAFAARGVQIARGDFDDPASLAAALDGATALFSVQRPAPEGKDSERRHGFALIAAARHAGVRQVVHTSVCEAGRHTDFPGWDSGRWNRKYWTDKWDVEEAVRQAGFVHWTVLKPAFMMDNFVPPKVGAMFPHLREGRLLTAFAPTTRLQLIAADDIGRYACAAFQDPARFHQRNIDLAAEALTMDEIALILRDRLGKPVRSEFVPPQQASAAGLNPRFVLSQEWTNAVGYRADIQALRADGIALTRMSEWVERHAADFDIAG